MLNLKIKKTIKCLHVSLFVIFFVMTTKFFTNNHKNNLNLQVEKFYAFSRPPFFNSTMKVLDEIYVSIYRVNRRNAKNRGLKNSVRAY